MADNVDLLGNSPWESLGEVGAEFLCVSDALERGGFVEALEYALLALLQFILREERVQQFFVLMVKL